MRRVAITGIGVVCPLGMDTAAFWNNCLLGNAAVAPIPDEWKAYCSYSSTLWAPLPAIDLLRFRINRIEIMQSDMTALLAIAAADQALAMSGVRLTLCNEKKNSYTLNAIDPLRCGVFDNELQKAGDHADKAGIVLSRQAEDGWQVGV